LSRKETVDALRKKIDQVDENLVGLLNERATLAQKIGRAKSLDNKDIFVPGRENEIFQRISRLNRGPLPERSVHSIYREILSASRSLEAPLNVAYFGPEATFTHMAARERFGSSTSYVPWPASPTCSRRLDRGEWTTAWCRSRIRPKAS